MNNIPRYFFLFCCLLITLQVIAQPTNCLDFNEPEIGTVYSQENGNTPDEVVYQYDGVNLSMGFFTDQNGNTNFDQIAVVDPFIEDFTAPSLYINYSTATFQYANLVNTLCFTGFLSGHEINFGINGEVGVFESLLDPNIQEEWPDYEIIITPLGNTAGSLVSVCIFGPIETFTIGGIEFLLDDVCTDTFIDCAFNEPNFEAFCQNSGSISLSLDFGAIIGDNGFVDVYIEDEFYDFYSTEAFPLVLENVIPSGQQNTVNVTVCINDIPECCYTEDIALPTCIDESCITFSEIIPGTTYDPDTDVEPGDVIMEFPGVNVSMGLYNNANGGSEFDEIRVIEPWISNLDAPSMYINFATATFSYSTPVTSVCFNTTVNNLPINFGINGTVNVYDNWLNPDLLTAFPNHTITVTPYGPNANGLVSVCISGIIEDFTVGGIELLVDDVCSYDPVCDISNLQVLQYNCQEDVQPYRFLLTFDHNRAPLDSFNLRVGGEFYGRYAYGDLPLSELEIEVDPGTALQFLVRDVNTENCAEDLTILTQSCESVCDNFAATILGIECAGPEGYQISLVITSPMVGQYVTMEGLSNGIIYGGAQSHPSLVQIDLFGTPDPEGYILADSLSGCSTYIGPLDFNPEDCFECEIYDVIVEPTDCNPNNVYGVTIDLFSTNEAEPLLVILDGDQTFGPFFPSEFPVTIGTLIGNPNEVVTVEIISINGQCSYFTEFIQNCQNCQNFQAELVNIECFFDDSLLVQLYVYGIEEGEPLRITSSAHPNFVYEGLFVSNPVELLVPLTNVNSFSLFVQAQGIDCETQSNNIEVPVDCGGHCSDFIAEPLGVDCGPNNTLNVFFELYGIEPGEPLRITTGPPSNTFITEMIFESNPIQISAPLVAGQDVLTIVVQAQGIDCETTMSFIVPEDCLENCNNFAADINFIECYEDVPYASLSIILTGVEINGQEVLIQNINTGTFYGIQLTSNPFVIPWPTADEGLLQITELGNGCTTQVFFEAPENCSDNCEGLFDVIEVFCTEGNPAFVFTAQGPAGLPFFVRAGGQEYPFVYGQDSYQLIIDGNVGVFGYELRFRDQQAGCVQEVLVDNPCFCFIEIISATPTECDDNGLFFIDLEFEALVSWDNGLFVLEAGGYTQTFEQGSIITTIGPFESGVIEVIITEVTSLSCAEFITVQQTCEPIDCETSNLVIEGTNCNANGDYFLDIDFDANIDGPFVVFNEATGESQTVTLDQLPVQFGPYNINEIQTSLIIVYYEATNSCTIEELYVHECEFECPLQEIIVTTTDCDPNGLYQVIVGIEASGNGPFTVINTETGDSFTDVFTNDFPLTFGPYSADEYPASLIQVIYSNAPFPCILGADYSIDCGTGGECDFNDVFAEAYACDGDQFMVDVAFNNPNGGPLGFYIFGDGMIFGPFAYGETFYTFGPLDGSEEEHDILLLDIANPACFGNYNLNYSCSDDCNIQQVIATPTECDGEVFGVEIDVIGTNLGETFTVVGNGNNYGVFNYADLPILLGPFEGDATTSYEFGVIDLQNPGCTNFTEIEPVNCLPCDIRDLAYEVDCGNDTYSLTLNFIYENPESDGFRLQIGGETVESFAYAELPITITLPYAINGETIRVEDFTNELCGETIDFEVPCCSLGNIINELEVADCQDNGEYYFTVGNFNGGNLSDSLVINYAPAGSSIIATEVVAYSSLPVAIGPLVGDGATSYIVVLNDQENECAATTTIEPVFCDNDACVEFEGVEGVFAPAFGYDSGDVITVENDVILTYERNPSTNCACNLFVTDGIPGVSFGNGHIVVTQNSGFGLNFTQVNTTFNTVNIDYYYNGGEFGIGVNGQTPAIVSNINDIPLNIAPGVELQATADPTNPGTGMLTFSGDNIETILLFTDDNAGFDNVCMSLDDNVWPGDTNSDNIASHVDLLSIGLTFGNTGPSRNAMTSEWTGLISQNWGENFVDGTNHKHADANGDGVVDMDDIEVLEQNYGLEHGPTTIFEPLPYTDLDPPIFVDLSENDQLPANTVVEIPVVAGSPDQDIQNIYGLAFTLELDPEIFSMGTLEIIYPTSWFGEPGINTATIHQVYPDGRVEVAISRTDHNNVSGFGPIMYLRIIIDDIAGVEVPTEVVVKNLRGLNHEEEPLVLRPGTSTAIVTKTDDGFDRDALINSFGIFPNPTTDWIHFQNQYYMAPNKIDIFNAAGQHMQSLKEPGMHLDVSFLPAGVYMLQVHMEGHIFTEKLVKLD